MNIYGDDESFLSSESKSEYISGASVEDDPLSSLDDFSPEENSTDDSLLDTESAMGTEYDEPAGESNDIDTADNELVSSISADHSIHPHIKKLSEEDIKRIAEKNKREKKLSHKNVYKPVAKKKVKAKSIKKVKKKK